MTVVGDDPGAGEGYDESPELDLTPRTAAPTGPRSARKQRPIGIYLVLVAIVLGVGFVVLQGLDGATLYFRNVDEAVAERDELGTRRFRLQGLITTIDEVEVGAATFEVAFNGDSVPVQLTGDRPPMFGEGQPVVLEGHFDGGSTEPLFLADRALVRHSEEYEAEHEDRVVDAGDGTDG